MTKKVFWEQPYLKNIETRIAYVDGSKITVDETIFFAFSGGQESDRGSIGGYPVIKAEKVGHNIEYTLPDSHNLKDGEPVKIEIDWKRRYRLMRLHFAAELILELMYRKLKGAEKIGAHIGEHKARIDFRWDESITPLLQEISSEAKSIIQRDSTINSSYSDELNEKRFWKVEGFAKVPCGGTHLSKTGEVGNLKLKRKNIGRGKERVEIYLNSES